MTATSHGVPLPGLKLNLEREFEAPVETLFRVWTEQELVSRWWGPEGFTTQHCSVDARVGGTYRVSMRSPNGTDHTNIGEFLEVVPNERLVFTYAWEDEDGQPKHPMMVSVHFESLGQRSRVQVAHSGLENEVARDSHGEGWESTLNRLAGELRRL